MTPIAFRRRLTPATALAAMLMLALVPAPFTQPRLHAQSAEPRATPNEAAVADSAALVVGNRTILVFRAPLGTRLPRERAEGAARRIRALVEARVADSVWASAVPEGILVSIGNRGVLTITPADVDTLAEESMAQVAARAVERLRRALDAELEQRSTPHLLRALGMSVVSTALFVLVLRLLRRLTPLLLQRLPTLRRHRLSSHRLSALSVAGVPLRDHAIVIVRRLVVMTIWAAGLFAAYVWLTYLLTRFPYTRPWGEALGVYLVDTVRGLLVTALDGVPGLITVVIIFIATRFVARLVAALFAAVEGGDVAIPWVHPETANPTRRIVVALLWVFAIVIAYPYLPGSGSDVFKGVSVFIGIVLSLGSSGVVSQAMSGLVLMYARALKPGDYVLIGDTEGTVTDLGMLSTKIRTNKDEEITIPNGVVVGTTTKNFSRLAMEQGVVIYTSVTIRYEVPWRQVHAMLFEAARRTPELRSDPPPFVLQTRLSDWHVEYQLNVRLDEPRLRTRTLSALHGNIQDVFFENGVDILSPHYEGNHEHPPIATISRERWFTPPPAASG